MGWIKIIRCPTRATATRLKDGEKLCADAGRGGCRGGLLAKNPPDLRGVGDCAPAGDDTFAKTNLAHDVREIVRGLGLGPVDLVGMDIGTMVAYAYASRHPQEVRRLVLSESLIPVSGLRR